MNLSIIQGQHLVLRCHPQKWPTPMGFNRQEFAPPTGSHPQRHRKGAENYLHTVRSNKAKFEQLILNKTYPTMMTINSRLLDIQGYKGLSDSTKATTKIDPYFNILLEYFNYIDYT
jgi:hypothetical protein